MEHAATAVDAPIAGRGDAEDATTDAVWDLSLKGLTSLDDALLARTTDTDTEVQPPVRSLNASFNRLQTLGPSLCTLAASLRVLDLRLNEFAVFPNVLCQLTALTSLDLRTCPFSSIVDSRHCALIRVGASMA